jgi:hypothetical protein
MTSGRSTKKRLFKVLGLACVAIGVIALALPLWFPWILRPGLAHFGIRFDSYERVGYTQFALTNVRGQFGNVRFNCKRAVALLPPRWLWRRYSGDEDAQPLLTAAGWNLQIQPEEEPEQTSSVRSTFCRQCN